MGWFKRLRTSGGFGVHSPFAFSLITDTLRMSAGYAYYAYSSLPDLTARLIYRLAARLNVAKIINHGSSSPEVPFQGIGDRDLHVFTEKSDHSACECLQNGDFVLIINPLPGAVEALTSTLDSIGHGMSFEAHSSLFSSSGAPAPYLLLCPLPHLPRQHFSLNT